MAAASHASFLPPVLVFCAAAVVAVPLFRRLGQSAVLGYLAAGVAIGPSGLGLIGDPETTRGVAELGVVLLLFIIGLELKLSKLVAMRADILGLGFTQLGVSAAVLGYAAWRFGLPPGGAFAIGMALALSATAIALQMLEERGELRHPYGQRSFAVLLFQDLSIVPVLAVLPLLGQQATGGFSMESLVSIGIAAGAIGAVVLVGRYGLNLFFRLLARSGAREVLTASALLVVLGTALLMEKVGLSMAMGAFLAGLLLAESNFRHQLEADIEPFRGILLGLFFMSVGMSIDAGLVRASWVALLIATPAVVGFKLLLVAVLFRVAGSSWRDGVRAGAVLSPAGEFAFVLLPLAAGYGLMPLETAQLATALAALTMLLGPVTAKVIDLVLERRRRTRDEAPGPAAAAGDFGDEGGRVLVIGFGRFGQVVNQILLAKGVDVTVIDKDVERIRNAAQFGFRVYYGDGTRLDVLRAAGAERAEIVCICVDDPAAALKVAELVHHEFKHARTYARAYDRPHAIELMRLDVHHQTRETFEGALSFGRATLEELGIPAAEAGKVVDDVRRRDIARLLMQREEGLQAGADLLHGARIAPAPLTSPKARARALSDETRDILGDEGPSRDGGGFVGGEALP